MIFDQKKRLLQINLPTNDETLLIQINGEEQFSQLFNYQCDFLSTNLAISADSLLGEMASIIIKQPMLSEPTASRFLHGMIKSISTNEIVEYIAGQKVLPMRHYRLEIVPQLFLLSQTSHCRVFQKQGQTSIDIVKQVLTLYDIDVDDGKLSEPPDRPYCMQYNESDFDFIQRILSESSIFYYFLHSEKKHQLVLANSSTGYFSVDTSNYRFKSDTNNNDKITKFTITNQLTTGKFALADFLTEQSKKVLYNQSIVTNSKQKTVHFHYPGKIESSNAAQKKLSQQVTQAESSANSMTIEMQKAVQLGQQIHLTGDYFKQQNSKDLAVSNVKIAICDSQGLSGNKSFTDHYECHIRAIDAKQCWLPAQLSVKNKPGLQIASIVNKGGTQNKPLDCDQQGRMIIKFAWENYIDSGITSNQFDQYRVSAAKYWDDGIYRVGTPVLVAFINDDIDNPVILGAINTDQSHLLASINNDTIEQSVIQRIPGIDNGDYNNIAFNDKAGKQQLTINATKDLIGTSTNESFTSEQHNRVVKNKYQLQAGEENYQSDKLQRNVTGNYELTAKGVIIHGDLTLTGDLVVNGKVDVK